VALPLLSPRERLRCGALDLYLTTADPDADFSPAFLAEIMDAIADPIASALFEKPPASSPPAEDLMPWLNTRSAMDRMRVWVAVAILIDHSGLSDSDALAALRGYAFSHDTTLDDIADELRAERLMPQSLLT
jgi:hypothetical protein